MKAMTPFLSNRERGRRVKGRAPYPPGPLSPSVGERGSTTGRLAEDFSEGVGDDAGELVALGFVDDERGSDGDTVVAGADDETVAAEGTLEFGADIEGGVEFGFG